MGHHGNYGYHGLKLLSGQQIISSLVSQSEMQQYQYVRSEKQLYQEVRSGMWQQGQYQYETNAIPRPTNKPEEDLDDSGI